MAHQAGALYHGFLGMERLRVFLLPLNVTIPVHILVHHWVINGIKFPGTYLYTWACPKTQRRTARPSALTIGPPRPRKLLRQVNKNSDQNQTIKSERVTKEPLSLEYMQVYLIRVNIYHVYRAEEIIRLTIHCSEFKYSVL